MVQSLDIPFSGCQGQNLEVQEECYQRAAGDLAEGGLGPGRVCLCAKSKVSAVFVRVNWLSVQVSL